MRDVGTRSMWPQVGGKPLALGDGVLVGRPPKMFGKVAEITFGERGVGVLVKSSWSLFGESYNLAAPEELERSEGPRFSVGDVVAPLYGGIKLHVDRVEYEIGDDGWSGWSFLCIPDSGGKAMRYRDDVLELFEPRIEVDGRAVKVGDRLWNRFDGTPLTVFALAPERGRVVAVEEIALYPDGPKVKVWRECGPKDLTYEDLGFPQGDDCCLKCRHYDELGDGVGVCRYRTVPTGTLESFNPVVRESGVCGAMEGAGEDEWDL